MMRNLKNTFFILPAIAILLSAFALMNSSDSLVNDIANAIRQGKSTEIAKHFGPNVDLTLPGSEGTFSKAQAEVLLRNFFASNSPTSANIVHKGSSRDGSYFAILNLQTKSGDNFRVYLLLKKVSEDFLLHQIKFESQ
jgi:hypothetical protein